MPDFDFSCKNVRAHLHCDTIVYLAQQFIDLKGVKEPVGQESGLLLSASTRLLKGNSSFLESTDSNFS